MELAKKIIEISRAKGLRQEDLARLLGVSRETLSKNINNNPTIGTLQKIAEALGVPLSELFTDERETAKCPYCGRELRVNIGKK